MREFNCTNCGMCCGPVPVTNEELKTIKQTVSDMPARSRGRLMSQKREELTCIFWDTKYKNCSIYEARPKICQMFGFYQGMECPESPEHATKSRGLGEIESRKIKNDFAGILTTQIKWKDVVTP